MKTLWCWLGSHDWDWDTLWKGKHTPVEIVRCRRKNCPVYKVMSFLFESYTGKDTDDEDNCSPGSA